MEGTAGVADQRTSDAAIRVRLRKLIATKGFVLIKLCNRGPCRNLPVLLLVVIAKGIGTEAAVLIQQSLLRFVLFHNFGLSLPSVVLK